MDAPRSRIALAALLPALLEGCLGRCGEPYRTQGEFYGVVDVETLARVTDAYGELISSACDLLCTADAVGVEAVYDVRSCEVDPVQDTAVDTVGLTCNIDAWVNPECKGGRHHVSVRPRAPSAAEAMSDWLARAAWEEAASVGAFRRLARELARHGGPPGLVARARDAARDEIRHARAMRRLAGVAVAPAFDPPAERTLAAIAVENAVEGCVRETWAALVGLHQARAAAPPLRPLFACIAGDETRHGQWSWDLDAWARTRLGVHDRRAVDRARRAAADSLIAGVHEPRPGLAPLGLPPADRARKLAVGLARAIA